MSIETYVRTRTSATDDRRSGTLATGPARITIGGTVIDVADGETVLIEIDELADARGTVVEPPSRELRRAAEASTAAAVDDEPRPVSDFVEPSRKRKRSK